MKLGKKLGIIFVLIAILPFVAGMSYLTLSTGKLIRTTALANLTEFTGTIAGDVSAFFFHGVGLRAFLLRAPGRTEL